jgi:uncharacterized protein YabE (DUF348 family)
LSVALLAGGTTAATALHKDVTLSVDGRPLPAAGFALTVADVLANGGITLGERDLVYPALSDSVADGQTITVEYSKQVTLHVDGDPVSFFTTATSLDQALAEFRVRELEGAKISLSRSTTLPRTGISVAVTTPKDITVRVAGKRSALTTTAATVAELLAEQGIEVDSDDRLEPTATTEITEDLFVIVDRVEVARKTRTEAIEFETTTKKDSTLWSGESRLVQSGKDGKAKRTYQITTVNGRQTDKKLLSEKIVDEAVNAVRAIGTKTAPSSGKGINLARAAMWDRIARCESGGRWNINTGNGYYGGLQFARASWNANGGRDFAAYPHQASRAEQITVANRYYAKAGLQPWGCRHAA